MEMHQVRYFLAAAKHLNFTRAAAELNVAQPSLTRAIQILEAELGGPLFRRERANTHLTELGRLMLPHLQATFAAAETAKTEALRLRRRDVGALTLGISTGVDARRPIEIVLETVSSQANLALAVDVSSPGAIDRRLTAGEFDAAIFDPAETDRARYDLRRIAYDTIVVAHPETHRFRDDLAVGLAALHAEPLVATTECPIDALLAEAMETRGLERVVRHRANDPRWMAGLVRKGLGCAVIPEATAISHCLSYKAIDDFPLRLETVLATVPGRRHSAALSALITGIGKAAGGQ